jgi:hypothetical protein
MLNMMHATLSGVTKSLLGNLSRQTLLSSEQKWTEQDLDGFYEAQSLALSAAKHIAGLIQPGWTEIQAARLFESYLRDYGVQAFFHRPFVWFGKRTRFAGIQTYKDFMPTNLRVNELSKSRAA